MATFSAIYIIHNFLNICTRFKLITPTEPTFIPLSIAILHYKQNTQKNICIFFLLPMINNMAMALFIPEIFENMSIVSQA